MLDLDEEYQLSFEIEATDPLGKNAIKGSLISNKEGVKISYKLRDDIFLKEKAKLQHLELSYKDIVSSKFKDNWIKSDEFHINVKNPDILKNLPCQEIGTFSFNLEKKQTPIAKKIDNYINYKVSFH